jgi:hypothetical protein
MRAMISTGQIEIKAAISAILASIDWWAQELDMGDSRTIT